ncbi:MAG: ribosome-associated toxin RatA of RatAB toxin-antitoxin module [Myxococcota bacterium]|jgi:ribosome-associated toxin RatA of RatAB toxin-antitoxin module
MAGVLALGAGAFFLLAPANQPLKPGEIPLSEEMRRLDAGETLLIQLEPTGGEGVAAQAKAVIEAPVSKVWPAVRDCQHFSEFMPRIIESELRKTEGNTLLCYIKVDMPWPVDDLEAETLSTIEELPDGVFKRSWTLTKGSFKRNNGSYVAEPFRGDANRTLLTYSVDVSPDVPIPDVILKKAQSTSLPEVFIRIAERVGAKPRS